MRKGHAPDALPAHRFFHAMVVMGGTVALGCGGATTGDTREGSGQDPDPAVKGSDGAGDPASSTGGFHMESTGGMNPIPTGGATNSGGASSTGGTFSAGGTFSTGGTASAPWDGGPTGCVSEQWTCGVSDPECSYLDRGLVVPNGCTCNENRPTSAADCGPGQTFVCRQGTETSAGDPLPAPIRFECACIENTTSGCDACYDAYGTRSDMCDEVTRDGGFDVLCGCAVIVLR